MRDTKKGSITIRCQMDEELKLRQMKNRTSLNKTHPNLIKDDALDTSPPVPPRRLPRLALPEYNRSNSANFARNNPVYEMLAHTMEAPKNGCPKVSWKIGANQNMLTHRNVALASHTLEPVKQSPTTKIDANPSAQAHLGRGDVQRIRENCQQMERHRGHANGQVFISPRNSNTIRPHHHIHQDGPQFLKTKK